MGALHYMVLVVRTHMGFSLRHAIMHTLSNTSTPETEERRIAFNNVAQRTREFMHGSSLMRELDRNGSVDWMRISNNMNSFTSIFSVFAAVQWIRGHFKKLHPDLSEAVLEGFGLLQLNGEEPLLTGQYVQTCNTYDKMVEEVLPLFRRRLRPSDVRLAGFEGQPWRRQEEDQAEGRRLPKEEETEGLPAR